MKGKEKNKGITLIALVITIIIMLILVVVTISLTAEGGLIEKAKEAAFKEDIAKYREELALYVSNAKAEAILNNTEFIDINEWDYDTIIAKKYIPSLEVKYSGRIGIVDNELAFLDTGDRESKWAADIEGLILKSTEATIKICVEGEGNVQGIEKINENIVTKVGKEYSLTAIAGEKQGVKYTFEGWRKDGKIVSTEENYTFKVGGDSTYTAVFTPEVTIITYLKGETEEYCIDETNNLATYISQKNTIGVENITKVEFGNGCTEIPGDAFNGCTGLTKVNLNNVKIIKNMFAFVNCSNLKEVYAPNIENIGHRCFENCNNLQNITLGSVGNPVTSIDSFAFNNELNAATMKIYIDTGEGTVSNLVGEPWRATNAGIEYYNADTGELINIILGQKYRGNTEITWDKIPNKELITAIRSKAFEGCTGLTYVDFTNIISIGSEAFEGCTGLTHIDFPNDITSISSGAFKNCTGLTGKIMMPDKATVINDGVFQGCTGIIGEITIPDNITEIGGNAFNGCTGLTKVNLNNVKVIKNMLAFANCSNLKEIYAPNIENVGHRCFENCNNLQNITLGSVGNPVTSIDSFAFNNELNAATMKIYIDTGEGTVSNLAGEPWRATNAGIEYYNADTGELINIILGQKYRGNTEITWDEIPNKELITAIRSKAFEGCTRLTHVDVTNITSIGSEAFKNCTGLTGKIMMPDEVTTINEGVFQGCTGIIGEITIPDNITEISGNAFNGCTGLTKVNLNNVKVIKNMLAFANCSNLKEIYAPNIKNVGHRCFENCSNLKSITLGTIGNPVTSIDKFAFNNELNGAIIKIYIDTEDGTITSLAEEPWRANKASIEYYDSKTGNKVN